jgi:hypothetical protein
MDGVVLLVRNERTALVPDRSADLDVGRATAADPPGLQSAYGHPEEFSSLIFVQCSIEVVCE